MANNSTKKQVSDTLVERRILLTWLEEIGKLHAYYQQLNALVASEVRALHPSTASQTQVGQCPVAQLIIVRDTIRVELSRMLDEIDSPSATGKPTDYERMDVHNHTLGRLNRQAQLRLDLATYSAT